MEGLTAHAAAWRDFIFDLLFPAECLSCGRAGDWLCAPCRRGLPLAPAQYCLRCKKPNGSGAFCADCAPAYALDGVMIAGNYEEPLVAELIKTLKYRYVREIAAILGGLLADFVAGQRAACPALAAPVSLLPIPLHPRRRRWRGFNQAGLIARSLAAQSGLPLDNNGLARVKHRPPQARLKEKARLNNIIGCFSWHGRPLEGENFLLIDDVVTTGATLNEAAKTLKAAGAGKIWGLVAAKG